jgi:protein-L-isoaspartate(D-aspartate) O-methyltransferase
MTPRQKMIWEIRTRYGLDSPRVFRAMQKVAREKFIPLQYHSMAYMDNALPIGFGQTISQPYTVAFMTKLVHRAKRRTKELASKKERTKVLEIGTPLDSLRHPTGRAGNKPFNLISDTKYETKGHGRVLEIGTGSGYQAAVLSELFDKVYSIEVIAQLARRARRTLKSLGFENVKIKVGNGEYGWAKYAPYDAILLTAGVEQVPRALFEQLKVGGVLVAPIRGVMTRYTKLSRPKEDELLVHKSKFTKETFDRFDFVPFVKN